MNKILLLLVSLIGVCLCAQQGKVGINTNNPTATLDIVSKANTSATKALKISNSSSTEMVTVKDNGQVGINQANPATDALLELNATNKALLLTRVSNATDVATPVNGMILYDTNLKCLRAYENNAWSSCLSGGGGGGGTISSLDCAGATNSGSLTNGVAASGVTSVISYTGGNGGSHSGQTVTSTGVTGLTAILAPGSFATGAGTLIYTITGTPSATGTASFAINIGGQTCTLSRTVTQPFTVPPTINLGQNRSYILASAYDQDYLPYTTPTAAASTSIQAADGSNEAVTIDIQGSITTTGVTVKIPVTATGSGTLPAFNTSITVPANLTEDGISRNLTLSWSAQAYTSGTTSITATIASVGGTLNVKKLDVNAGIGNDFLGVLIGTFVFPYNNAGNTTTYKVRALPGIPDKMFGIADNTGSTTSHLMLYLPIVAEDGKVWLNNNLGAHYSNITHPSFNLAKQASSANDYLAYGSFFQWGRKPDGHELITFTNGTTAIRVNGITPVLNDNPNDALFIAPTQTPLDWRINPDSTLWDSEASPNNPCPSGFRVPTNGEFTTLLSVAGITNIATAATSILKLPNGGFTNLDGNMLNVGGSDSVYNTSTGNTGANNVFSKMIFFYTNSAFSSDYYRSGGAAIRCIKD